MKKENTQSKLEEMKVKPIAMHHHRIELRRILLTSSHWDKNTSNELLFWKGGESLMKKTKFVSVGIALSVIAVVVVTTFVVMPKNTTTAYADQLAQKSYESVSNLPLEQQEALKQKVHMDPQELLKEAKNAKDLKILTYEEFASQHASVKMDFKPAHANKEFGPGNSIADKPEQADMQKLTFLQFTNKEGSNVILGIDEKNLPVFALVRSKDGMNVGFEGNTNGANGGMGTVYMESRQKNEPTSVSDTAGDVTSQSDGKTIMIKGKKYAVPSRGVEKTNVRVEGDNVYINDVKVTPEN